MSDVQARFEAAKNRDVKRMTKSELTELATKLHLAARHLENAAHYESVSTKHPVALKQEEIAETLLDDAILYFATIRSRVVPGPMMLADGSVR
ncbi:MULTISPECIES: hypothetical protein [unclassified Microbacterium]|uniref:hypothetical protein n=1 Tax=unclassified Microbacterium TaxID=2609290 RepID=UPI000EAA44C8|nr:MULTISPECIES: hypothetical protein [unclassified Microbacterium]MBT2485777.1 hypothetical protein [Microbacterium sp. ISL-108]RKN68540.1 hypothetical protein D7252_13750 [Microbacterium sp. CGR2]